MRLLCVVCSRELRLLNSSYAAAMSCAQCQVNFATSKGVGYINHGALGESLVPPHTRGIVSLSLISTGLNMASITIWHSPRLQLKPQHLIIQGY